jgi:hypothetical protein
LRDAPEISLTPDQIKQALAKELGLPEGIKIEFNFSTTYNTLSPPMQSKGQHQLLYKYFQ